MSEIFVLYFDDRCGDNEYSSNLGQCLVFVLYDRMSCPPREKVQQTTFTEQQDQLSIYDFEPIINDTDSTFPEGGDQWAPNDR